MHRKNKAGGDRRPNVVPTFNPALRAFLLSLALSVWLAGCENFDLPGDDSSDGEDGSGNAGSSGQVVTTTPDGGQGQASMDAGSPGKDTGEQQPAQRKTDFVVAQPSEDFIFVPNPANRAVTVIDPLGKADTRYLPAGSNPAYLGVCSEDNVAVAIDKGAGKAAVIRVSAAAAPAPVMVDVGRGANAVAFSPRCYYALVYYDPEYVGDDDRSGGHQEVSIIDLERGEESSVRVTVGLRPRHIIFEKEGKGAFLITEDGVSKVVFADLFGSGASGSAAPATVDFGRDLDTAKLVIGLTPYGGRFITGYEEGSSELYLLDDLKDTMLSLDMVDVLSSLHATPDAGIQGVADDAGVDDESEESEETKPVTEAVISQVSIGPSGSFALAAIRDPGVVLMVKIDSGFKDPSLIVPLLESEVADSVVIDPNEKTALVFDRAGRGSYLNVIDLEEDEEDAFENRRVGLAGPVDEIHYAPDGLTALIIHNSEGAPWEPKATGYSVLAVDRGVARFHATSVRPGSFEFAMDAGALFMLVRDDALGTRQLHRIALDSLLVDPIDLERRPRGLGVMKGDVDRVLVDQVHADGHITLFDWAGTVTDSLVGFQIVDRIKE